MATVKFNLSTKTDKKTGKSSILLRFIGGRTIDTRVTSGLVVNPNRWDKNKMRLIIPRLGTEEQKELVKLQTSLDYLTNYILDEFVKADKATVNKEWLELAIDRFHFPAKYEEKKAESTSLTLLEYIEDFIQTAPNRRDIKTGRLLHFNNLQQYKATQKHLIKFSELEKKTDYQFSDLNNDFYKRFVTYLQTSIPLIKDGKPLLHKNGTPKFLKKSFTQNSVGKHIKILKLMLKGANSKEADISTFHVFTEDIDTVYLNEIELKQLEEHDFSSQKHLEHVRDWFLLLCWTGSRFSDLGKIDKTNIKDGFLTFRQKKTNNKVKIPLHPVVTEILTKYNFKMPNQISNQKFNEYIKEVCEIAKIDSNETFTRTVGGKLISEKYPKYKLVSSHTGRRSFCTNMYKRELPTLMIMAISGHRTEKSFMKYIKVKQDEHAEMMDKKWKEMFL